MTPPLLRCERLRVGYGGRALLPAVDLEVRPGELWAILGRNGNGKTTFFRTLLGLLPAVDGAVLRDPALRLAYVPQRTQLDPLFPAVVRDVVAMGCERGRSFTTPRWSQPRAVDDALARIGISDLAKRPFRQLSEGQKQRVLLARLLVARPTVALLDEPTSAMDEVAEREALDHLDRLRHEHGTAIMVVSHQIGAMRNLADRALLLDASCGEVVVGSVDDVVSHHVFEDNYGGAHRHHAHPKGAS